MWITLFLAALSTQIIHLGEKKIEVEIADTSSSREKGLMGRDELSSGKGMLFIFPEPQYVSFWMKNTKIPLSIGFFDEEKRLFQTLDMPVFTEKKKNYPIFQSDLPTMYALEVPLGWFRENKILIGAKFSFQDLKD